MHEYSLQIFQNVYLIFKYQEGIEKNCVEWQKIESETRYCDNSSFSFFMGKLKKFSNYAKRLKSY